LLGTVIEAVYFVRVLQVFYDRGGEGVAVSAARMEAPAAALLPILLFALFLAAGALLLGDITEVANAAAQDLVLRLTSLSA
jgi:hypothetical protein